jgi:L-amino acid N-acyltransferase
LTEKSGNVILRDSSEDDLPQMLEIYNDAIVNLTSTFDLEPQSIEERRIWFRNHGDRYPLVTAQSEGKIVGYCSISPFSQKPGYNPTVELSVYVHKLHRQRGIGKLLMADVISKARRLGYNAIISIIACDNDASIRLHKGFGFEQVGHLRAVGYKFSKWQDVDYYELLL